MTRPVPLKHRTETAFIVLLGVVLCVFGFLTSLLPALASGGLRPWSIVFATAVFYPLLFRRTLRINRADYEFRALHWFPAFIVLLWLVLELSVPYVPTLHYLQLGFFFFWSLPLVTLGVALLVIFSLHVIRRRVSRVTSLTVLLLLFFGVSVSAKDAHLQERLQKAIFVDPLSSSQVAMEYAESFARYGRSFFVAPDDTVTSVRQTVPSSTSISSSIDALQAQGELQPVIDRTNLDHLSKTGPELYVFLFLTLLALYSVVIHQRARMREGA